MFSPWTVMLLSCDWACAPYALWAFADIYTGLFWDSCWITCRAQRCGLPEALHGCWLKENKCFVLGISSSFQEVELSLNMRYQGEQSVLTWYRHVFSRHLSTCEQMQFSAYACASASWTLYSFLSLFLSFGDCSQLSNEVEGWCGPAEAPLPAG